MSDQAAAPGAPERPRSALAEFRKNPVVDLILTVTMAVAIAYAVQLWIVKPYRVPSQSMEQTLHVGDRILAARFLYHFVDPEPRRHHRLPPQRAGQRRLPDRPRLEPELRQAADRHAGRVGRVVGRQGLRVRDARAGQRPGAHGHARLPVPEGVVHDVADGSVQQHDGRLRPAPPRQGSVPDARRQPPVLGGLALLGRDPPLADHRARVRRSTGRRRASRASDHRRVPDAIATARRVHAAAAADLELVLADIARWVAHDSPSGALAELDALAADIAETLSRLRARRRARAVARGPARARRARGRRARARRAALPSRHRLPARHRRAATAAARGRAPDRARGRRT